jgi:peroxiredoxin
MQRTTLHCTKPIVGFVIEQEIRLTQFQPKKKDILYFYPEKNTEFVCQRLKPNKARILKPNKSKD